MSSSNSILDSLLTAAANSDMTHKHAACLRIGKQVLYTGHNYNLLSEQQRSSANAAIHQRVETNNEDTNSPLEKESCLQEPSSQL